MTGQTQRRARRIGFETLEGRQLLAATDFASLVGRVFDDFNGNGFTAGEEIAQATVQLYRDNGDGTFQAGADSLVSSKTTDARGAYRFNQLTAGSYFVRQPAQDANGHALLEYISSRVEISAADASGVVNGMVDSFQGTPQSVAATAPGGETSARSTSATAEAIGGERDLHVTLTSNLGELRLNVNTFVPNRLEFAAGSATSGHRVITWDGVDGNASTLNATGLNGTDLTKEGLNTAIQLSIGADHPDGVATLRVYTDANNWSQTSVPIPATGGSAIEFVEVPFSSFVVGGGNGANFGQVGALQLEVEGKTAVDGQVDRVALLGPKLFNQNFANFEQADLSVTKTVSNSAPRFGENVTFSIAVANAGPNTATAVAVADAVPAGMDFVSATASQGSYSNTAAVWTVGTVTSGASASLQIVAKANTTGLKTNVAQVSAAQQFDPDSAPNNNSTAEDDQASAALSPQLSDLSLQKIVDNTAPNIGQNVTFVITLSNAGPTNATNVAVTDLLPSGLFLVSATSSQGSYNPSNGVWAVGSLNQDANATLNVVARVDDPNVKINSAQITSSDQPDPDSSPNNNVTSEDDHAAVSLLPQIADLSLAKTVNSTTPNIGQNVTFVVTVSNAGPSNATNVVVTDRLPTGVNFVSATASQGSFANTTGVWNVGSLSNGGNATLNVIGKVDNAGSKVNSAQITGTDQFDPDSLPNNNVVAEDDQSAVSLTPQIADLSLTKSVNNPTPNVGENVTFTLSLMNAGPSAATNVAVTDQLPAGLELVSATSSQGEYLPTGVWTVGSLANGANASVQITAKVTSTNVKTNTAQVSSVDQFDPDSLPDNSIVAEDDQSAVSLTPQVADLSLTKSVNHPSPNVGENVTFTLSVVNAGPSPATNVAVTDQLPAGLEFVSATSSQGEYLPTGVWTVGSLADGANASLQITAKVTSMNVKTNTAQVSSVDQFDPDSVPRNNATVEDDQASAAVIPPVIDLSLTKAVNTLSPTLGDNITFTIDISNAGPNMATDVVVKDQLPTGMTFVSATATQGSYVPGTGIWTVGSLGNGASGKLQLVVKVESLSPGVNTAQVHAARQMDVDSTPSNSLIGEDDLASVRITPVPPIVRQDTHLPLSKRQFLSR